MSQTTKLPGLDSTRFYAAISIVLFHLVLMPRLAIPEWMRFIPRNFAIGVPLFYAVSAFSLYFGYYGKVQRAEDVRMYFVRRFFRIAPLFYLLLVVYLAYLSFRYGKTFSIAEVLASVLFVFNLIPKYVAGIVWASWSIGVEMLFYVVLPVLLATITSHRRAAALFGLAVFISALFQATLLEGGQYFASLSSFSIGSHAPHFAGGIVAFFTWRIFRSYSERTRRILGCACLAGALFAFFTSLSFGAFAAKLQAWHMLKACQSAAIAIFIIGISLSPIRLLVNSWTVKAGKASYSLYLWHPLVISLLNWAGVYNAIYYWLNDGPAYAFCAAVTLAVLTPLALFSYHWIEVPGMRLASRFESRASEVPLPATAA